MNEQAFSTTILWILIGYHKLVYYTGIISLVTHIAEGEMLPGSYVLLTLSQYQHYISAPLSRVLDNLSITKFAVCVLKRKGANVV